MGAPDRHPNLTLFFGIWAAVGPLAGILIGHLLTRSWQRKQWLLDCRKEEFRELVSVLTKAAVDLIALKQALELKANFAPKMLEDYVETHHNTYRVIADRIYIAKDISKRDVGPRYLAILRKMREHEGEGIPTDELEALLNEIIGLAVAG